MYDVLPTPVKTLSVQRATARIYADFDAMSLASAQAIAAIVRQKPDALICLSAGDTAVRTYEILIDMQRQGFVSFENARFVQLDDWLDLEDESCNCTAFLDRHFYTGAGVRAHQLRKFDLHAADMHQECRDMEAYLAQNGPIDCVLLGLGMNGHLGLNEPGSAWDSGVRVVELSDTTKTVGQKYFDHQQALTRGVTLGIAQFLAARCVVLQVGGRHKAEIVAKLLYTEPDVSLPGSVLCGCENANILLDADAASQV